MVRIKYRYLLVDILNPEPTLPKAHPTPTSPETPLPDVVQFHSPCPNSLTPQLLVRALKDEIQYLYGDYGLGLVAASLVVKYLSPATSTAIIRVAREHFRIAWAALSFMTHLPPSMREKSGRPCVMRVVRVSGTIRKAEEEVIRRARWAILKARREGRQGRSVGGLEALLGDEEEGGVKVGVGGGGGRMGVVSDGEDEGDEEDEEEEDEDI